MNPEVKKAWLEALRSGAYKQAEAALEIVGEGFCCLGVLCDLAVKKGITTKRAADSPSLNGKTVMIYDTHECGVLPTSVLQWAELNSNVGSLPTIIETDGGDWTQLTELNDHAGYTFSEIADVIEQQF